MKVPTSLTLAAIALGARMFRDADPESDGSAPTSKGRKIAMDDGRELMFGEKQKLQKEHGVDKGNVFARIDFDNGKSIQVIAYAGNLAEIAGAGSEDSGAAAVALAAMGHGLSQKLGDAAAGAETTDDAYEAILEVATRFNKGEWNKQREGGGGSAKGAGDLVIAMTEFLGKDNPELTKDKVREMLAALSPAEKNGLRKLDEVAAIIERIKAERQPSAKAQAQAEQARKLADALKSGKVPERQADETEQPA